MYLFPLFKPKFSTEGTPSYPPNLSAATGSPTALPLDLRVHSSPTIAAAFVSAALPSSSPNQASGATVDTPALKPVAP